jgi:hypothetical protein
MTRRASTLNGTDSGISREIGVQYANVKFVADHIDLITELAELAELDLTAAFDSKVDKVAGKELSDNNYTDGEKTKLAGLEGTHFKGEFVSLPALQTAWSVASVGDYANVDMGVGADVLRFVWDDSDQEWVEQLGVSTQLTGAQIKTMYEDQPDTNAFTDTEKAKLAAYSSTPLSGSTSILIDVATQQIRTQAVTGEVTIPQNGVVATITNKAVNNTKLADMAGDTVKGKAGTAGTPTDLTPADLRTMLNVSAGATVGADWNTNLSNIPAPLVGITTTGASLLQTLSLVTISFPRMNADRTVTYLSAADLLSAISAVSLDTAQTITGSKTFSVAVSVASLGSSGTIGAAGAITSGTSVSAPAMSGGTANFGSYSGGAAVLTGTSQLDFLGVGTSSLGSDRLRVNGTSTFYGHATVNGDITATNLIGAGSGISGLTKAQVGLSNVDNTSDVNKPISSAVQTEFNTRLGTAGNLGTMAQQNANTIAVTGGSVSGLSSLGVAGNTSISGSATVTGPLGASTLAVSSASPTMLFLDTDTAGANITGFTNYKDSTNATIGSIGFFNSDGSFEIENTGRIIRFDSGQLIVEGFLIGAGNADFNGYVAANNFVADTSISGQTLSLSGAATMGASSSVTGNFTATGNFIGVNANLSGSLNATGGLNGNAATVSHASSAAVKVASSANSSNYGSMYYNVGSSAVFLDRSGTVFIEASGTQTRIADQVGAPILTGNTVVTRLYRGGFQCFEADATNTKLQIGAGYSPFDASTTQTTLKAAGNTIFSATATDTNVYRGTVPIILASPTNHTFRGVGGAPVLDATSTTTAINAGSGAPSIVIDGAGAVDVSGNVTLSGTSRRIKADLSNATITNRLHFQSNTVNGATRVAAIPNGTGTTCNFEAYNNSDPTNASAVRVTATSTDTRLESIISGTGIYLPLQIYNNGAAKITIPPAGNILFNEGNVQVNAAAGQSSLWLSQAGTVNGRIYASGGGGTDVGIDASRFITLNPTSNFFINYAGSTKLSVNPTGDTVAAGTMTATNFYGNGFNLTQLNATEVKNGLLPSNIFPSTISAATITFDGAITIKGGGIYNRLVLDSSNTVLRNVNGNSVFSASATDLSVQRDGNIILTASSTGTQLFSRTTNIAADFTASTSQLHSPGGAPFIQASTTVTKLNAVSGAPSIEIDSSGSAMIKFPQYLVSTKPSASANSQRVIIISDAALGYGLYISDGTNWRSAQSGTVQA